MADDFGHIYTNYRPSENIIKVILKYLINFFFLDHSIQFKKKEDVYNCQLKELNYSSCKRCLRDDTCQLQ